MTLGGKSVQIVTPVYPEKYPGDVDAVFADIMRERQAQNRKWGGTDHDDTHEEHEWTGFMAKFLNRAETSGWLINHNDGQVKFSGGEPREVFESNMIQIAALAVAAVQSSRRKRANDLEFNDLDVERAETSEARL